jgi:two-component system response regulator PilR (NtrC family)
MARILVVEDDEEMRSLLKDFLLEEGYEAVLAGNGSEALRKLAQQPFDLVLSDIRMPGPTGLDILPAVKRLQPEVAIIVITAFGSEEVRRQSLQKGATAYLEKPIHSYRLKALIQNLVSPGKIAQKEEIRG